MSYLLRVVLPDRPGSLGAVATALGQVGADILSLDVVERRAGCAVDDLLVALPPGGLADTLISSAQSVPGVVVESLRPYSGSTDLHRDLELVDELAGRPAAADLVLAKCCPAPSGPAGRWWSSRAAEPCRRSPRARAHRPRTTCPTWSCPCPDLGRTTPTTTRCRSRSAGSPRRSPPRSAGRAAPSSSAAPAGRASAGRAAAARPPGRDRGHGPRERLTDGYSRGDREQEGPPVTKQRSWRTRSSSSRS